MININRDMIATRSATELMTITDSDFLDTFDAHDDAAHFAELCIIELRDDIDLAILIHCPATATDAELDDFADAYSRIIDNDYDFIYDATLDSINRRLAILRP